MKRSIYIAGPMTGISEFNFPAFDKARDRLIAEGWAVVSPADLDRAFGFDPTLYEDDCVMPEKFLAEAIRRDLEHIQKCDAIYLLDGWEKSNGALAELGVAKWMGMEVVYETPAKDDRNPKDVAGSKKCPMHLLPPVALEKTAWAHGVGAGKYGPYNWRAKKISASQYIAAVMRHLNAWHIGQNDDSESGLSHLAHIAATVNILMDACEHGCLIDDRNVKSEGPPPSRTESKQEASGGSLH